MTTLERHSELMTALMVMLCYVPSPQTDDAEVLNQRRNNIRQFIITMMKLYPDLKVSEHHGRGPDGNESHLQITDPDFFCATLTPKAIALIGDGEHVAEIDPVLFKSVIQLWTYMKESGILANPQLCYDGGYANKDEA